MKKICCCSKIRPLKNKIDIYMTSISKSESIDKLDDTVNDCHNTYQRTIKMKPVDTKLSTCIDYSTENN